MADQTPAPAPPSLAPTPAMGVAEPLTLLDHWVDVQRPALTHDLKARLIPLAPGRDLALGRLGLPPGWRSKQMRLSLTDARALLTRIVAPGEAGGVQARDGLRLFGSETWGPAGATAENRFLLDRIAGAIASGEVWAMNVILLRKESVKGHPDAEKLAPMNVAHQTNVDCQLLSQWEGGQWRLGYVPLAGKPRKVVGHSGVTIGSGVDLGQKDDAYFSALGVSQTIRDKLRPYFMVRFRAGEMEAAVAHTVARIGPMPLLTKAQADELDAAVMSKLLGQGKRTWDGIRAEKVKTVSLPSFVDLPSGWQTVWFSRTYHGGPDFINHQPGRAFGLSATQGKWTDAIRALRSFPEQFAIRGNEEADACEAELPKAVEPAGAPGAPSRPQAAGAPNTPRTPIIPGAPRPPGPRGGGGP